jgi:hypothetical protein
MLKYTRFEDLPVWQDAAVLYCSVLDLLEECSNHFSFGFRTQLDRSANQRSITGGMAHGDDRAAWIVPRK